ncbi:MAG: ChaB family protein [Promicromonosporaceae bacterium]|nr:ChaB family protein [Promicromonosporaceae bacterium]
MPIVGKNGEVRTSELPSTLRRSSHKAQETFAKAHDAAAEEYHSEERAYRVAWAAVKHEFKKSGDHWTRKS